MFSGLPPKADLPPNLTTTPAVNSSRTPPSRPHASPHKLATRDKLPIFVVRAVSKAGIPSLPVIFVHKTNGHRHPSKRLHVLTACMDDDHFKAVEQPPRDFFHKPRCLTSLVIAFSKVDFDGSQHNRAIRLRLEIKSLHTLQIAVVKAIARIANHSKERRGSLQHFGKWIILAVRDLHQLAERLPIFPVHFRIEQLNNLV